jgi:predicted translin family RNA/ssDNA-binding protein
MYSYGLLETGCYYLMQEKVDGAVSLIKVMMESDHCMYIFTYDDQIVAGWKRKTDPIFDIIECLSDAAVETWEKHYNSSNEDVYNEEDEE